MLRGDRMRYCVCLIVFLAITSGLQATPLGDSYQPNDNGARAQRSSAQDCAPQQNFGKPDVGSTEHLLDSLTSNPENTYPYTDPKSYRDSQRADQDLAAQQTMALWTKGMFWAALGSLFVTGAGVLLVFYTLRETQKTTGAAIAAANAAVDANDQARTFFVEQQRARLSVNAVVSEVSWEGENARFEIAIKIDNIGRSNAENVQPHPLVMVHPLPSLDAIKRIIDEKISKESTFGNTIESDKHIVYKHNVEIGEEGIKEWRDSDELNTGREIFIIPTLILCVTHNITFDKVKRHTTIVREVRRIDDIVHKTGFRPSQGIITHEKIATQRHIRGDMFAT